MKFMSERNVDRLDREELDASIVPPAHGRDGGALAGCLVVSLVLVLPALLYFGLFGAILLDELVFEANLFMENVPEEGIEVLRVIYAPLIWLFDQFDG
jgi:hypothetical protein